MFISDCDLEDGQDRKFNMHYHHHDYKKVGDITFAYSSRYVDIDVESVKDYLGCATGGDTKNYTYTPLGVGYNIKITPKQEKVWGGEVYDITTENGTIVHVSEDITDKIYIYNDFEDDSDIWFFTESEDEYGTLENLNSFTIKKITYTETVGLYKAERKR
jgi:hypothetical protein